MYDSTPIPFSDIGIIIKFFAGLLITVIIPGYLLIGRRLASVDLASRFCLSLASGLAFTSLFTLVCSWLGVPIFWWANLSFATLLALILSKLETGSNWATNLSGQLRALGKWDSTLLVLISIAVGSKITLAEWIL